MAKLQQRLTQSFRGTFNPSDAGGGGGGDVPSTRNLIAGAGLTGGGDLSADRTFNVVANADGSITVNANDIQVGILATDAQHGNRGGGSLHSAATTSTAGFMSSADKTKLDTFAGVAATVSVATTSQGTATALTNQVNVVTGGNQFDGCRLPASWPVGVPVFIFNRLGGRQAGVLNFVRVFPNTGENLTAQSANLPHFLVTEALGIYTKISSTEWHVATCNMPVGQSGISYTDDEYHYRTAQFLGNITLSSNINAAASTSIRVADNQGESTAFFIGESTNKYQAFVSTDSAEAILFYKRISGYLATLNTQTSAYSFVTTAGTGDSGKVVEINSASAQDFTLPPTAPVGSCVTVCQVGAGQITFVTSGSGTIRNANSQTKTRAQWSVCSAYVRANVGGSAAEWVLSGDTGP
jgi:hypothetical protein